MNVVQHFRHRTRCYRIGSDGTLEPTTCNDVVDKETRVRPSGLGDFVSLVLGQRRVSVAIYVYDSELRLAIGERHVDLLDVCVQVKRVTVLPFVKTFEVNQGSERVLKLWYLWIDVLESPFYGTRDILKFVSDIHESRERTIRFFLVWRATKNGDDVTSPTVRAAIEESVAKINH